MYDSENRWRFWKSIIFDKEKIPLIIVPDRSMKGLSETIIQAKREGAGVFVGDQLSTPWTELLSTFAYEDGRLPIERLAQVKRTWNSAVFNFQDGPFHAIGCGRLGFNWERVENEQGYLELTQGDSKFNAGGGNNFGYECGLEVEMKRKKHWKLLGKLRMDYISNVVKDAAGVLNGKQFVFTDFPNGYKVGDYKTVLDAFRPHIDFLATVDDTPISRQTTRDLLVAGESVYTRDQKERGIIMQEYDQHMEMAFGGMTAQAKMFRNITTEMLTGSMSRLRMEEETSTDVLRNAREVAKAIRVRVEEGQIPTNQDSLRELVRLAEQDIRNPGSKMTLLEVMGRKSVESIQRQRQEASGD